MYNKNYKFLPLLTALYITFQLVSDVIANKIIQIGIFSCSVTVLYFPITYILSDVLTEVYGYSNARKVVWLTFLSSVLAGLMYQAIIIIPTSVSESLNISMTNVLGSVPRILVGGWLAVWGGAFTNDYILAKLKIITKGKYLWFRTISSTVAGEGINTLIFYTIALSRILPSSILWWSIFSAWIIKVMVEIIFTPITYMVINKIKHVESEDHFDYKTNFNPFKL